MTRFSYESFVIGKNKTVDFDSCPRSGSLASHLFEHQAVIVDWALRRGRAAVFADTGLGKTAMELEWARHVATAGRVLILTPLAVAEQTVQEACRFGVHAEYARRPSDSGSTIVVTNYDLLDHFSGEKWAGVVLDESSILKAYDGKTRNKIISGFSSTPYRLACTATPAPNDFTELGNHSEFLGIKTRAEMLAEYFVHDGGSTQDWRLKGHGQEHFWSWVCSWAAAIKRPSDLGFPDDGYDLPPLEMHEHVVNVDVADANAYGMLIVPEAKTLSDQRATRRMTLDKRVALVAKEVDGAEPAIVWCELNDEADACERAIPGAVQIAGSDSPDTKASRLRAFAAGEFNVLVSKPSVAGFGLNWQHCAKVVFAGASHSYEQTYQAIRRCWRFGQKRPVNVHIIRASTEGAIVSNYRRKEADAERLSQQMTKLLRAAIASGTRARRETNPYEPELPMSLPNWMKQENDYDRECA